MSICNDTGFSHLSSALGIKTITLMADTPLTLAETASVFGEMLVFRKLLDESHIELKKQLLATKFLKKKFHWK